MIKNVFGLVIILALFILSIESLVLRYIQLPALRNAAIIVIHKQNGELMKMQKGILDLASENGNDKEQIYNLQIALLASRSNEAAALSDKDKAIANEQTAHDALNQQNQAATDLLTIIKAKYIPIDECVVFKTAPCMNGHDELKGTDDDSICGF